MQSSTGLDNIQRIIYSGKYGNKEYPLVRIKERCEVSLIPILLLLIISVFLHRYDIHDISFMTKRYLQQAEEIAQVIGGLLENGIIQHDNKPAAVRVSNDSWC